MKWIATLAVMLPLMGICQTYECDFVNTDQSLTEQKTIITMGDQGSVSIFSKDTIHVPVVDIMMASFGSTTIIIDVVGNTYMFRVCKRVYAKKKEPNDTIKDQ